MIEIKLEKEDFIALCDLLKVAGLTDTAGVAKHIIAEGHVKVDGAVELRKRAKIRTGQLVEFNGEKIKVL